MKKYKTWEVIKMMTENEGLEFKNDSHVIGASILGYLKVKKSKYETLTLDGNINLNSKWELVKQPVTFEEVLNSDKGCRVEHELVNIMLENSDITFDKHIIAESFQAMKMDEYIAFDDIMLVLSKCLGQIDLRIVIKGGKWYLED